MPTITLTDHTPNMAKEYLRGFLPPLEAALARALQELPEPARPVASHILGAGGKRMRPLLTVLCGRLLGYQEDNIYRLACSLELLHASTLLHDDVLDNADTRRGEPSAHTIFGQTRAILAGDAMLALGNAIVAEFRAPLLTEAYSRATMETAAGEILEMDSLHNPQLDESRYLAIATGKTGCLISQSCLMGALAAGATPDQANACAEYGENLGIAFQLVDDALDFAPESQTGKPSGGDLREGKMTLPLRLYRESLQAESRDIFDHTFRNGRFTEQQVAEISQVIEAAGYAAKTRLMADEKLNLARACLKRLPVGIENEVLLYLADYVRDRRK